MSFLKGIDEFIDNSINKVDEYINKGINEVDGVFDKVDGFFDDMLEDPFGLHTSSKENDCECKYVESVVVEKRTKTANMGKGQVHHVTESEVSESYENVKTFIQETEANQEKEAQEHNESSKQMSFEKEETKQEKELKKEVRNESVKSCSAEQPKSIKERELELEERKLKIEERRVQIEEQRRRDIEVNEKEMRELERDKFQFEKEIKEEEIRLKEKALDQLNERHQRECMLKAQQQYNDYNLNMHKTNGWIKFGSMLFGCIATVHEVRSITSDSGPRFFLD